MAKSKNSRKGKKEWRRNISTVETESYLVKAGREERSGGPLDNVPSENLFFVDKSKAPAVKLRKVDKARAKILHSDSILKRGSLLPPVPWAAPRPTKTPTSSTSKKPSKASAAVVRTVAAETKDSELPKDLWSEEDLGGVKVGGSEGGGEQNKKRRRLSDADEVPVVPAVEVDQPGCSFNPAFEDHQNALAKAVADEVGKETRKEIENKAPPLEVLKSGALDVVAADLEMYSGLEALLPDQESRAHLLEAAEESAEKDNEEDEEENEEEEEDAVPVAPAKPVRVQKMTRADLNRKLRRRDQEAAAAAKLKKKQLMRDVARVVEIAAEADEEQQEVENRRLRREIAAKEKRLEAPPRLGKHKFEPEPVNVLLTEEVTGSLRQLKGCFTLARDRFKSLQKRGILEPRVPVQRKAAKRKRIVEVGTKGQKEREMHAEILQMRAARTGKGHVISLH